jgi:cellulase/cellobiase CelA1
VEAYSIAGAGHVLPLTGMAALAIQFFGLNTTTTTPPPPPPTTTPPPTSTPPVTTAPPPTGGCHVADDIVAWDTGLTSNLTITNTGSSAINGWSLKFTLPGGQAITSGWNATYTPANGQVTATNLSYDAAIPPGGSVSVGFQANHTGNAAAPPSFAVNGATCG